MYSSVAYLQSCEMYDTVNLRMLLQNFVKTFLVCDVDIVEIRFLAADEFDSIQYFGGGVVEVIDNDHFVASFEECEGSE